MSMAVVDDSTFDPPGVVLARSTEPRVCQVCGEIAMGSTVLPEGGAVCDQCTVVALRWMIVDRQTVQGSGSGAFRPNQERGRE